MQARQPQRFFENSVDDFIRGFVAGVALGKCASWGFEGKLSEKRDFIVSSFNVALFDLFLLEVNNDFRFKSFILGFMGFLCGVKMGYSLALARQQVILPLSPKPFN